MEFSIQRCSNADIISAVKDIKTAILTSRYNAARMANREQLTLYFNIGEYISIRSRSAKWGTAAIASISELLQKELPGLRGFSESGIKRMRTFYRGLEQIHIESSNDIGRFNNYIRYAGHIKSSDDLGRFFGTRSKLVFKYRFFTSL